MSLQVVIKAVIKSCLKRDNYLLVQVHVTFWKKRHWAFNQIKNEQVISQDCNENFILEGILYFQEEIKNFKFKILRRFFRVTLDLLLPRQILLYLQLKYTNSYLFTLIHIHLFCFDFFRGEVWFLQISFVSHIGNLVTIWPTSRKIVIGNDYACKWFFWSVFFPVFIPIRERIKNPYLETFLAVMNAADAMSKISKKTSFFFRISLRMHIVLIFINYT